MAKRKFIYAAALLLTGITAAWLSFALVRFGSSNPPMGLGIADISITAEQFCSALNSGDHGTIEGMIGDYSTLHLDELYEAGSDRRLYKCLSESYRSRPVGEGTVSGMTASQDIEVSYFSLSLAAEDVKLYTREYYDRLLESGRDNSDLYDENGALLESVAMDLYESAIDHIIDDSDDYTTTEVFTLEMTYENGRWDILLTNDLVRILLGGVNTE